MKNFYVPDLSDKRIYYAAEKLSDYGYTQTEKSEQADFLLLGVNPDKRYLIDGIPIFAGNISGNNIFDYTKEELFSAKNAYLTAEATVADMITNSPRSLINSKILIVGYGRIGKALLRYLSPFTSNITVCARSLVQRSNAAMCNARVIDFDSLTMPQQYDFLINTVPHPVINKFELAALNEECMIFDLASFPGGVDKHLASAHGNLLIQARGLPALYSPKSAGCIVAETVFNIIEKGRVFV